MPPTLLCAVGTHDAVSQGDEYAPFLIGKGTITEHVDLYNGTADLLDYQDILEKVDEVTTSLHNSITWSNWYKRLFSDVSERKWVSSKYDVSCMRDQLDKFSDDMLSISSFDSKISCRSFMLPMSYFDTHPPLTPLQNSPYNPITHADGRLI